MRSSGHEKIADRVQELLELEVKNKSDDAYNTEAANRHPTHHLFVCFVGLYSLRMIEEGSEKEVRLIINE